MHRDPRNGHDSDMPGIQTIAFTVAMILGAAIMGAVLKVYLSKKRMDVGDAGFALMGVLLVGLSVWSSATIKVGSEGFEAKFDRLAARVDAVTTDNVALQQRVATVAETSGALSEGLAQVGEKINRSDTTLIELTEALERKRALQPATVARVREAVEVTPKIEVDRFRALSEAVRAPVRLPQRPRPEATDAPAAEP